MDFILQNPSVSPQVRLQEWGGGKNKHLQVCELLSDINKKGGGLFTVVKEPPPPEMGAK